MTYKEALEEIHEAFDGEMRHGDWENHAEECQRRCEAFVVAETLLKQNTWIPVSERLPEEGKEVLVSGYDTYNKKVIIAKYQGEQYGFTCGLVSAWMPLPQPYKTEREK